jgi:ABC-type multidrug transport system ATPase subunit
VVGYVEQSDIHTAATTVAEALWFSARLRLPPSVPDAWVKAQVMEVLDMVDLASQAQSLVGDPAGPGGGTGLSTEQRKRLTIAVELVAQPRWVLGTGGRRMGAGFQALLLRWWQLCARRG